MVSRVMSRPSHQQLPRQGEMHTLTHEQDRRGKVDLIACLVNVQYIENTTVAFKKHKHATVTTCGRRSFQTLGL